MDNPFNEYSIQLYIGEPRSGKTNSMVGDTYELIKDNPKIIVYANFELNKKYFPTFIRITKKDLETFYKNKQDFKNCIFLIDEAHIFLDSRNFMHEGNKKIGYLLGQMGKRGNILKANTHFPRLVDFRLRSYCERWIYVYKVFFIEGKIIPIMNYHKEIPKEQWKYIYIYCEPVIRKLANFQFEYFHENAYLIKADKYFNMYDTEEFVKED